MNDAGSASAEGQHGLAAHGTGLAVACAWGCKGVVSVSGLTQKAQVQRDSAGDTAMTSVSMDVTSTPGPVVLLRPRTINNGSPIMSQVVPMSTAMTSDCTMDVTSTPIPSPFYRFPPASGII